MEYVIINAAMYLIAFLIYWFKKRRIDLGFLILAAYACVAILGLPVYIFLNKLDNRNITLLPFLYLFVILFLFIRPYLTDSTDSCRKIHVRSIKVLDYISYGMIISAIVSVYCLLPKALDNINSGDWNMIRYKLYQDGGDVMYGNSIEKIALIYNQYFAFLAILIFFYYLSIRRHSTVFIFFLGISCVIQNVLMALVISSRGLIVGVILMLVAGFLLFKKNLASSTKKKLYIAGLAFLVLMLVYFISVTASRFGEGSNNELEGVSSNMTLIDYFGQSMLVFNDGVSDMHSYAYGKYLFKFFLDALNINSSFNQSALGGHWGTSFFTFVGALFIDFGPIGTFLFSLLLPALIKRNIRGNVIYFENIFLYFYFYNYFLKGMFVVGFSSSLSWLIAYIIYLILKYIHR